MLTPVYTRQFERDIKRAKKRGKNLEKLKIIARTLTEGKKLDPLQRDHQLAGDWANRRECHIEAYWLLIYRIGSDTVTFERTGSHSDLFEKWPEMIVLTGVQGPQKQDVQGHQR